MSSYVDNSELCKECSKCCNPTSVKIRLSPRDVFAIAYEKQVSITQVLKECCIVEIDGSFPKVWLNQTECGCVFNKNGECSLLRKPDVCASFPRGGSIWYGETEEVLSITCNPISETLPTELYRNFKNTYSMNDYFLTCQRDPFFQKWKQAISVCEMLIIGMEKESDRLEASELAYHLLYEKYELKKGFLSQFDKNVLEFVRDR